jgi:hypothetical protein
MRKTNVHEVLHIAFEKIYEPRRHVSESWLPVAFRRSQTVRSFIGLARLRSHNELRRTCLQDEVPLLRDVVLRRARDSPKGIPQEILPHFLRENPQVLADAGFSRRDPLTRIIHRSGQDRCSGERGIRTPKSLRTPVFKTGAIAVLPALQQQTIAAIVDLVLQRSIPTLFVGTVLPALQQQTIAAIVDLVFQKSIPTFAIETALSALHVSRNQT